MWNLKKIPKIAHFYWGGSKLSFLRYLSLKSFKRLNPDWQVILHVPKYISSSEPTWLSEEQKYSNISKNYFDLEKIKNLEISINEHDFSEYFFDNNTHEVHKSDFLRWKILSTVGGLWSDIDILYLNSIDVLLENIEDKSECELFLCPYKDNGKHTIGFLLGSSNNLFFDEIFSLAKENYDPTRYQSIGSELIMNRYHSRIKIHKKFGAKYFSFLDDRCVYSIGPKEVEKFYNLNDDEILTYINDKNIVGFHWYAGHPKSQNFENLLDDTTLDLYDNILTQVINIKGFDK